MPILADKKYVLSKIDNKEYCIINGQFNRYLASVDLTLPQYLEDYEGIKCRCKFCSGFAGVRAGFVPKDTCGNIACAKAARALAISNTDPAVRRQWNAAETLKRKTDGKYFAKITKAVHAANLEVGVDGLTGYERTAEKRRETLLKKYGNEFYANTEKTKRTWANKSDEEKDKYAKWSSEMQIAFSPEKKARIRKRIEDTNRSRHGIVHGFDLATSKGGFSNIASDLFACIDPGNAHFRPKTVEFIIDRLRPDFVYGKKIIEFFGDYWHQNPIRYLPENVVQQNGKSAAQIWARDKYRLERFLEAGYQVKIVWERDFKRNRELVIRECKEWLNS